MRSKPLPTSELSWDSPLTVLDQKKPNPAIQKLMDVGVLTLRDLLWLLPLRIHRTPETRPFRDAVYDQFFKGSGKVLHAEVKPAFGRRGKGNILLYNGFLVVKDDLSPETLALRWFNLYPNQKKQLETLDRITFLGPVQEYKAQKQITNPQVWATGEEKTSNYILEYPTVNKVPGNQLKKIIDALPPGLWTSVPQTLPELGYDQGGMSLATAFRTIHGRIPSSEFTPERKKAAEDRLIYEEFLIDQLKIQTRRKFIKRKDATRFTPSDSDLERLKGTLPFTLTADQLKVFGDVLIDLRSGHPMMRMIQGDVGCGKTIVAYLSSQVVIRGGQQVALMCPTEALATQHYQTFKDLDSELPVELLLGSTKAPEKRAVLKRLATGEAPMVIGTHSLFQDSVKFKRLGLAVIDEQHKFGVEQRLRLVAKGEGTHTLIMTATPIPRTLSLAQYGDLDISSIRSMPAGRKGIKTRITEPANYEKYLEFVRGRLSLGEQAYLVFPAIDESEALNLQNVKESLKKYTSAFRGFRVEALHGQMKPEEKDAVVEAFRRKEVHVLISTSVIEVGINVPNATVMAIYNPERFGLSSLHQLRGRVGRGEKGGFCFLVLDRDLPPEGLERLQVIEQNLDGFVIAEEDLRFRGEGDLFGVDQSGTVSTKKLANFITHTAVLEQVVRDLQRLEHERPELLAPIHERLAKDQKILDTV